VSRVNDVKKQLRSDADYLKGGKEYDPSDNWPSLEEAIGWADRLVKGFKDVEKLIKELVELELKTKALMELIGWSQMGDRDRPELPTGTKKTEILYHATVNVGQVLSQGLKSRKELDGKGKLGGGVDDKVSFTSDPKIAVAIAQSLLTVVKIANGEITWQNIMAVAKKQGIDLTDNQPHRDIQMHAKKVASGWEPDEEWKQVWASSHTDPAYAFAMFKYYLGQASEKGILYDPFFAMVRIDDFKGVRADDIGVVACRVNTANATYEPGMQEFRTSSGDISRCKKLNTPLKSVL